MYCEFANACILARESMNLTQEALAELCKISRGSISDYERGKAVPGEDIVLTLIEKLEAPFIGYAYLRINEVGKFLLPDIPQRHLASNVLDLQIEMNDVAGLQIDLAKIGKDNKIDEIEKPIGDRCKQEITEMIGAAYSVWLSLWQKEKTPVVAHRRVS